MKHCNNCNIDVNTNSNHCPLCFNTLENTDRPEEPKLLDINQNKPTTITKTHMVRKVFLLISLAVMLTTGAINYFVGGAPWSLVIFTGIVYLWIFVKHTIMSHRNVFEKILFHFIGMVCVLLASQYVSGGGLWFADYVLPAMLIALLVTMNMMLFVSKKRKQYEISFLIIELFILIVNIIFVSIDYCSTTIMFKISMLFTILSMAGIIIMDGKNLYLELTKKMHL